jgi:hypothetical protein
MASVQNVPPRLPEPTENYEITYMDALVRALQLFITQERNPGEERATKVTFTDLPTSDSGLEAGSLYRIGNDVKISLIDMAVPDPAISSGSVGTVTVSIS